MAEQKKGPPASVDELKARLGLVKKETVTKPSASPSMPPVAPGPVPPGIKGPAPAIPPPFLQPQKPQADMHRDPFAKDIAGAEFVRRSLIEGPKAEDMSVSIEDQKKIIRKSRIMTIAISAVVGIVFLLVGIFWGRGFSGRLIYNQSIEDAKAIYDIIQFSSKVLSDIKTKLVTAQAKASKDREAEYTHIEKFKEFVKSQGCVEEEGKQKCVLRLIDISNRSYNIYKPDIVAMLFTYSSQWGELLRKMDEHVIRTKNDQPALDEAKKRIEKLQTTDYAIVFTKKHDPNLDMDILTGNLAILAGLIQAKDQSITGFKVQGVIGSPSIEKKLYSGGDLSAEPEAWAIPMGSESKDIVLLRTQLSHFLEYQTRLQNLIELANAMDQNQKSLIITIGEIASLDKQLAF